MIVLLICVLMIGFAFVLGASNEAESFAKAKKMKAETDAYCAKHSCKEDLNEEHF